MNKKLSILLLPLLLVASCSTDNNESQTAKHTHHYIVEEGKEATCLEDGISNKVYCDECGYVLHDHDVIKAYGHNVIDIEKLEPTCTEEGHESGKECSRCGEVFEGKEVIPALGHDLVKIQDRIEPTHEHVGHTEVYKCKTCNEILDPGKDIPRKHVKGAFVDFCIEPDEFVENPGVFKCSLCDEEYHDTITYDDINFPILSMNGNFEAASKTNKITVECVYDDGNTSFDCDATIKLQGASSLTYAKKNYNIQLYKKGTNLEKKEKVKLVNSWGKQSKYTLKANYIDFTQARNIVSAKIFGQISSSRSDEFSSLINGGAIDGYPILIFENGVYQGIYTLNTPKEHWRFNMDGDETTREAILMCDDWTSYGALEDYLDYDFTGFELEHSSTEDFPETGDKWVVDSFNDMVRFVNDSTDSEFISGASTYINVPAAIDQMIYTSVLCAFDNTSKNILWVTYDGVKWTPTIYDLDGTWGLDFSGKGKYEPNKEMNFVIYNALWERLYTCFETEVNDRYCYLRDNALSITNIGNQFSNFINSIPEKLYAADYNRWYKDSKIITYSGSYDYIIEFTTNRLAYLDPLFGYSAI